MRAGVDLGAVLVGLVIGWLIFDSFLIALMMALILGGGAEGAQRARR